MVQRRQRERSLFEVLLPDGHKLWPDWLRKVDMLLEDEAVIEVVAQALEARWPQRRRRGRPGTPAEVVIRMPRNPARVSSASATRRSAERSGALPWPSFSASIGGSRIGRGAHRRVGLIRSG